MLLYMLMRRALLLVTIGAARAAILGAAEKKTYTYKTVGDLVIQADVYRPDDEVVRPAIFWIHGGALIMGQRRNLRAEQLNRYLDAGFAVVSIDYRLAPETKLPEILEDIQDAWRWVRAEGPKLFRIDPDRIAVVGHSAGGYLTLAAGYLFRPRPRALVSFYGYGKAPLSAPQSPNQRGRFYLYCRQQGLWPKEVTGRDPDTDPRAFDAWCPVRNVNREYPPTMLLHGDNDTDVPFAQSEQMAAELKRRGVEHEFIRVPGGPHGFDSALEKDPKISATFDRAVAFLKKRLN